MRWLIFNSQSAALARSQAAWADLLGGPPDPASGTVRLWGVRMHPTDGRAALEIPDASHDDLFTSDERAALVDALSVDWTPSTGR
jgi:hypothetical protein